MNVISDNALIGGFAAQVKPINAKFVEEVCRDFDIRAASVRPRAVSSLEEVLAGEAARGQTGEPHLVPPRARRGR